MTASQWRRLWFLYAIAATYTVSVVIFFVFARYRFPLVLVLLLLAAGGVAAWRTRSAQSARPWAFAAMIAAGVWSYLPLDGTRGDRLAHDVNIGNQRLADPRRWDDAAVFYNKALS